MLEPPSAGIVERGEPLKGCEYFKSSTYQGPCCYVAMLPCCHAMQCNTNLTSESTTVAVMNVAVCLNIPMLQFVVANS